MSEQIGDGLYEWQGFFGPMAVATAAKAQTEGDGRTYAWVPQVGEPPMPADVGGTVGMFAFLVRPGAKLECPAGLFEAPAGLAGRLVGG